MEHKRNTFPRRKSKDNSNHTPMTNLDHQGNAADDSHNHSDSRNHSDSNNKESDDENVDTLPAKGKISLGRRISSFHERIPIRIQNFLLKYILFVFNFLSWVFESSSILGLAIVVIYIYQPSTAWNIVVRMVAIGVGSWQLTDRDKHITDAMDFILDPPIIICIIGAITFLVAFPGFFGALRENLMLLKLFSLLLSLVLAVEVVAGILVVVFYSLPEAREKLRFTPETILRRAVMKYYDDDFLKRWMDNVQKQFKCCGVSHTDEGYKDWQLNIYFNCTPTNPSSERCAVPFSCCIFYPGERMNGMCGYDKTNKKKSEVEGWIYTRGCVKGFGAWLAEHELYILISAITVMIMQFMGVLFARIFVKRLRKQRLRLRRRLQESSRTSSLGLLSLSNAVSETL